MGGVNLSLKVGGKARASLLLVLHQTRVRRFPTCRLCGKWVGQNNAPLHNGAANDASREKHG